MAEPDEDHEFDPSTLSADALIAHISMQHDARFARVKACLGALQAAHIPPSDETAEALYELSIMIHRIWDTSAALHLLAQEDEE